MIRVVGHKPAGRNEKLILTRSPFATEVGCLDWLRRRCFRRPAGRWIQRQRHQYRFEPGGQRHVRARRGGKQHRAARPVHHWKRRQLSVSFSAIIFYINYFWSFVGLSAVMLFVISVQCVRLSVFVDRQHSAWLALVVSSMETKHCIF